MVDASEYHERTKHSPRSIREDDFRLDPRTRPRSHKRYRDLPELSLPGVRPVQAPALSAVAEDRADPLAGTEQSPPDGPDLETLATVCYEATGVVKRVDHDGRTLTYRAASCTGRLYHVDCYLVCGDCEDLDAGVYHFDPEGFAFDVLRAGDYRGVLAEASGDAGVAEAPATVVATSTWWRNAWKYRERTYRHAFWDSGTLLANLLAAAHALDYSAEIVAAFAEEPVTDLLGLDPAEEVPLELVPLGRGDPTPDAPSVEPIDPATVAYSPEQREYPILQDAWQESALPDGAAASEWRDASRAADIAGAERGDGERVPLEPVDSATAGARPLHRTVERRGSCREFADSPLSRRKLGTVLDRATRGVPGDWQPRDPGAGGEAADDGADSADDPDGNGPGGLRFNDAFCLVTDVDGVPDGTYQFHPGEAALERLGDVDPATMAHLALDQEWAGDAHVNVYLLADVERVVDELGNRGYRLAQLEAGVTLGRCYLATYAHRDLGGTGLTFYDDAVTDHLSPRAAGLTPTTLFALGVRAAE